MGDIFNKPETPAAPTVEPPPTMPDTQSPEALEAKRKARADANRSGRSSTILTTSASRAGSTIAGSTYSGSRTGAT